MISAVSVAQTTVSIATSLRAQSYNKIADEAAQAGVAYATSCLKQNGTDYWTSPLKPNTSCTGSSTSSSAYIKDQAATSGQPHYRSSFNVATPTTADSKTTAQALGKVELVDSTGAITKTWISSKVVVVNVSGGGLSAKKVVTGPGIICAIASNQQAYCSGLNQYGQLSTGSTGSISAPAKFTLPAGVGAQDVKIASGQEYSTSFTDQAAFVCVLGTDDQIYCAGKNTSGQLGDSTTTNRSTAVKFRYNGVNDYKTTSFALGLSHICMTEADMTIKCSGANDMGQLGLATSTTMVSTPTTTGGAYKVYADTRRSCVVTVHNFTYCTGFNLYGQNANGSSANPQAGWVAVPTNQAGLPNGYTSREISMTGVSTCILSSIAGCAGLGVDGQLGQGSTASSSTLVRAFSNISASQNITQVAASLTHNCVVFAGDAYCAGRNTSGQLGDGTTTSPRTTAVRFNINSTLRVKQVAPYSFPYYTCVLAANSSGVGSVWCSGENSSGQLGDGTTTNKSTPVQFQLPSGLSARQLAASWGRTCVIASDSQVYCAGANGGSLGDGTTTSRSTPVKFPLPSS